MRELKRIFCNRVWLSALVLLTLLGAVLYLWEQRAQVRGPVSDYARDFPERAASVREQAERILSNPFFAEPGSFASRNAEKTAQDYARMEGRTVEPTPADDVAEGLLQNRTSILLSLCLVAVTVLLLLEPERLGLEGLLRAAPPVAGPACPLAGGGSGPGRRCRPTRRRW